MSKALQHVSKFRWFCHFYRLPTKLREGNVFTSVSLLTMGWVCLVPSPFRRVSKREGGYARRWVSKREDGYAGGWYPKGRGRCTVGKRAVHILLECFLFNSIYSLQFTNNISLALFFLQIEQCILPNVQVYFKQSAYEDSNIRTARSKTRSRGLLDNCISKLGRIVTVGVIKKILTNNWNPNFKIASFKSVQLNSIDISDGISAK